MKKTVQLLFALILFLGMPSLGGAQGWEKVYGTTGNDLYRDVEIAVNGDLLVVGAQLGAVDTENEMWAARLSPDGDLIWEQNLSDAVFGLNAERIINLGNGSYLIVGAAEDNTQTGVAGWIIDEAGNTLDNWINTALSLDVNDALLLPGGDIALAGAEKLTDSQGQTNDDAILSRINAQTGAIVWEENYNGGSTDVANALVLVNDQLIVAGYAVVIEQSFDGFLLHYDLNGQLISDHFYGSNFPELFYDLIIQNDQILVLGQTETFDTDDDDPFILTTTLAGDSLNFQIYNSPGQDLLRSLTEAADGTLYATGDVRLENSNTRDLKVWKFGADASLIWEKSFGGFDSDLGYSVASAGVNQTVVVGYTNSFGNGVADGYVISLDSVGQTFNATVTGTISWDKNLDCVNNASDVPLDNWIVLAERPGEARAAVTDANGQYALFLGPGTYTVSQIPPNNYWTACVDSVLIDIIDPYQIETLNFDIQALVDCPLLYVDVSTPFLRRCFQNRYSVVVENRGTDEAVAATVSLTVDEFLLVDSFSIDPISQAGNVYEFAIGDLAAWETFDFFMWATVDCDNTVIGQTHCVEAYAMPDSICTTPSPEWDQASMTVNATCDADSIIFTIKNEGEGANAEVLGFVIIEDDILLFADSVGLNSKSDTTIVILNPEGSTYRLQVEQSPGHPGNDEPSITIEGCGGSPNTGYVIILPQNDGNPFVDIDCRENQGSFDPNAKAGFPRGYGDRHFISPETELEYLIQFQNTGTDTAFRVVLRDTLSALLDLTRLAVGSASHSFDWYLRQGNILVVEFDNILLPDSTTNLAASQGWIEFKIAPKAALEIGSIINNRAGIYFDFNEPIITEYTFHEIGENFILDLTNSTTSHTQISGTSISVFPNPFQSYTDFKFLEALPEQSQLSIFTAEGRLHHRFNVNGQQVKINTNSWPPGIYIYQWESGTQVLGVGKIILQR